MNVSVTGGVRFQLIFNHSLHLPILGQYDPELHGSKLQMIPIGILNESKPVNLGSH